MLYQDFTQKGYAIVSRNRYINRGIEQLSLQELQSYFETELQQDGPRRRAYLKLQWDRLKDEIKLAKNQAYFQSAQSNADDGGKLRQFKIMNTHILELPIMQRIINTNKKMVAEYEKLMEFNSLTFGLHFIRYQAEKFQASYSSPVGLHIDDEPLVFVHLINLSSTSLGGDNLIARLEDRTITNVIRLEKPLETLVLNNNCFHAVTPLGSKGKFANRDIILFTVEPESTQFITAL